MAALDALHRSCSRCTPVPPPNSKLLKHIQQHSVPFQHTANTSNTSNFQHSRHKRKPILHTSAVAETACTAAAVATDVLALPLPTLLPASGPWGVWAGLICAGAFGMWSERTRLGKELSGALVATLAGEKVSLHRLVVVLTIDLQQQQE